MNEAKSQFLESRLIPLLRQLPTDTPPRWGRMTVQQMIEHFSDSMRIASGKTVFTEVITPQQHLERLRNFLESDKPFKENTVNVLMPEIPAPVKNPSCAEAISELQKEIDYFFQAFRVDQLQVTRNPFFGDLNFAQNVQLLHKHALHHLRQFGIEIAD